MRAVRSAHEVRVTRPVRVTPSLIGQRPNGPDSRGDAVFDATADKATALAVLAQAHEVAESDVWLFGDGLGAAFATAQDVTIARDRAQRTAVSLRRLWQS